MITTFQQSTIEEYAYVPEHMIRYVTAISQTEPFLLDDYLAYRKRGHLIFVGYPLKEPFDESKMVKTFEDALSHFRPREVALTAPCVPASIRSGAPPSFDQYYRLDLASLSVSQKVRNMVKRAGRMLKAEKRKTLTEDHDKLVREFLKVHPVSLETQFIFKRIPDYVSSTETAWVYDARNEGGDLVAFDVAEMAPKAYAFYMFNFTSRDHFVPGASDLLLWEIIQHAQREDKRYINLGLGIDPGVTFFKEKWGGKPFLPYTFVDYAPAGEIGLEGLLQKL